MSRTTRVVLFGALLTPASLAIAGDSPQADVGVAMVTLEGTPLEQAGPFDWLISAGKATTLGDYVALLEAAAEEGDIDAVLIRVKDAALSTSQIEELGRAISQVRSAGKSVHVFAENYGTQEILLGSLADSAIIQSGGSVSFPGLYMEEMYLADTFAWLGIEPDFVQVGDYKGANEMYMNSGPSEAWEQNVSQLLDSMYANLRASVSSGRGLSDSELDSAMEELWWADAERAIELGIVDAAIDLPNIKDHLSGVLGGEVDWIEDFGPDFGGGSADLLGNPFALMRMLTESPDHRPKRNTIAIVHIEGAIVAGDGSSGGLFGGKTTGSRTIRNALEDVLKEDKIGGVIVRINSPGGSAIASEIIWQGLQRVGEEKPVWISVGSMAASGGYYIAVGGQKIYVNQNSIVGSIGVVGGKLAMGGLYDKAHINVKSRSRGPRAALMSSVEPWTERERALIRERMVATYEQFTGHVEDGREGIDLAKTAEGRVFTGDKAIDLKMADAIGSLDTAIGDLAAELDWDRYDVMHYPGPKSFDEMIEEMFGGFVQAPGLSAQGRPSFVLRGLADAARQVLGDRTWSVISGQIEALGQLRNEPVVLTMPRALIFK